MSRLPDLFTSDDHTLVPGALRGYRRWKRIERNRLQSTGMYYFWPENGVARAECLFNPLERPSHEAPGPGCECGLYGWYDPKDARIPLAGTEGAVFGVIEATGRTILGSHGFRASGAKVVGVTSEDPLVRDMLRFSCPFPVFDTEQELVKEFPPQDMSSLVDHECGGDCLDSVSFWTIVQSCSCLMCQPLAQWQFTALQWQPVAPVSYDDVKRMVEKLSSPPMTAKEAALEARRNRNTGPQSVSFKKRGL